MFLRIGFLFAALTMCLLTYLASDPATACCPAGPKGQQVVNADQTVIIIWDAAKKTQHFIRQASFRSEADDFAFLVPSPNQPELAESSNDAFERLKSLTAPEIVYVQQKMPKQVDKEKSEEKKDTAKEYVKVLEQKIVAGFNATVLETNSTVALVKWLQDNGYFFSPAVEAWAKPYVEQGWKITALKVAKDTAGKETKNVAAKALRMSFKTDRPLFPYREPDSASAADILQARRRLLRIFFLAEARYKGELTKEQNWTGAVAWAGKVDSANRSLLLTHLNLPETTGPAEWWLTEFEDYWPYKIAPADVYFSPDTNQAIVRRPPIYQTVWITDPEDTPPTQKGVNAVTDPNRWATSWWVADSTLYVGSAFLALLVLAGAIFVYLRTQGKSPRQ